MGRAWWTATRRITVAASSPVTSSSTVPTMPVDRLMVLGCEKQMYGLHHDFRSQRPPPGCTAKIWILDDTPQMLCDVGGDPVDFFGGGGSVGGDQRIPPQLRDTHHGRAQASGSATANELQQLSRPVSHSRPDQTDQLVAISDRLHLVG